jgi:hypothetical protein
VPAVPEEPDKVARAVRRIIKEADGAGLSASPALQARLARLVRAEGLRHCAEVIQHLYDLAISSRDYRAAEAYLRLFLGAGDRPAERQADADAAGTAKALQALVSGSLTSTLAQLADAMEARAREGEKGDREYHSQLQKIRDRLVSDNGSPFNPGGLGIQDATFREAPEEPGDHGQGHLGDTLGRLRGEGESPEGQKVRGKGQDRSGLGAALPGGPPPPGGPAAPAGPPV